MDIWDAIGEERLALAERLAELSVEQWDSPSLCAKWRIRDVFAHVTAGAEGAFGVGAVCRGMLRHGFNFSRWMAADGQARGQQDPAAMLKALRSAAGNRKSPPGAPTVSVLADVLIHGQDICRPLGIARDLPEDHLRSVADFVKSTFVFGAKRRIAGLKLTATDIAWSHGQGLEVTGSVEALVMVMAGRTVAFGDLSGDGKATLTARY